MSIEVVNIAKTFHTFRALRGVSLKIEAGELVALLGPSGSGKTTLLRIIAGLEQPDEGSGPILFDGEEMGHRAVGERRVGFVFQHYALFRHMTVYENVAFGLRVRPRKTRPTDAVTAEKVHALLRLVHLDSLYDRYPSQLSGGQRQRVALARSLAVEPKVLLLDEPFGALDAKVRQELRRWLRRLHDDIGVTSVFVTHDQEEALEVADRIVVMNEGTIEQVGTPDEVFHRPATEFVMKFLGNVNLFHGRVGGGKVQFAGVAADVPEGSVQGDSPLLSARVFVRPHELDLSLTPAGRGSFPAKVTRIHSAGPVVRLELEAETGEQVFAHIDHLRFQALGLGEGSRVFLLPRDLKLFTEDFSV